MPNNPEHLYSNPEHLYSNPEHLHSNPECLSNGLRPLLSLKPRLPTIWRSTKGRLSGLTHPPDHLSKTE
jgi:hypothetical protein